MLVTTAPHRHWTITPDMDMGLFCRCAW